MRVASSTIAITIAAATRITTMPRASPTCHAVDDARTASTCLGEAAAAERRDRVFFDAELAPQCSEQRAHVGLEGGEHDAVRAEHVAYGLCGAESCLVDEQRLRKRRLDVQHRLQHRVDL